MDGAADNSNMPENRTQHASGASKLAMLAPLLPLIALVVVWLCGGLSRFDTPDEIAEAFGSLRDNPYGFVYTLLAFGLGTLFFMPITALVAGTLLAFGSLRGFFYAFVGVQLAAATTYYCGRVLGGRALDQLQVLNTPLLIGREWATERAHAPVEVPQ